MTQFSNTIAETQYAKKASHYINILNDLRRIGAHSAVDLPTIVFCGNQSAGKSSLLEAISSVQLPRSDGTCTRCVMELRLIELETEWSCQISLRQEYDEIGNRLSQPIEAKFGSLIKSHKEVELMARRAQKALLNPSKNSDDYLYWNFGAHYDDDANNELKFTKNVVCLEIKGKNVPNLSLIDLPGIISDPAGRRTLGVLTKPDTIEAETHDIWLKILRGESHKLSLGYYIVKNPSKIQLNNQITFEEARKDEENFFKREYPWKNLNLSVKRLQYKLSELLIQAIRRNLPKINKEIRRELENVPEQLSENSKIEIYRMVKKCVNMIEKETSSSGSYNLLQMINTKFSEFNNNLCLSRPIFVIGKESIKFDFLEDKLCNPQPIKLKEITGKRVMEIIANSRGRLIPGFIPYSSAIKIIKDTQIKWKSLSLGYVEMKIRANKLLDNCKEITLKYIDFISEMEINQPFTIDEKSITILKSSFLKKLYATGERSEPTDALDIIASLLAYFKIVFRRYADTIAMTIVYAFIDEFTKRIEEKLMEIYVNEEEQFDIGELVQEDHNVSFHREDLRTREKHLKNVLDSLKKFGIK
ncbi:1611_t:CDS:2 [Diversispora eburnea]|uniref:1611_t:CDS:1 n=1 Tax=Diversispora eburnea TaxID=1213867 RepID=A0A9N8ZDQ6_9GLOM|nr:1611_t:CDS:2 [Diversispora eburnea]